MAKKSMFYKQKFSKIGLKYEESKDLKLIDVHQSARIITNIRFF